MSPVLSLYPAHFSLQHSIKTIIPRKKTTFILRQIFTSTCNRKKTLYLCAIDDVFSVVMTNREEKWINKWCTRSKIIIGVIHVRLNQFPISSIGEKRASYRERLEHWEWKAITWRRDSKYYTYIYKREAAQRPGVRLRMCRRFY